MMRGRPVHHHYDERTPCDKGTLLQNSVLLLNAEGPVMRPNEGPSRVGSNPTPNRKKNMVSHVTN